MGGLYVCGKHIKEGGRQWFSFSRYQYIGEIRINPTRYWTGSRAFFDMCETPTLYIRHYCRLHKVVTGDWLGLSGPGFHRLVTSPFAGRTL